MKYIFSILLCAILQTGFSQIIKTVGISYTNGTPTYTPAKAGSALALDTVTWRYYTWNGSTWISDGFRIQTISGCAAPAYTPTKFQSYLVINACTVMQGGPELYFWTGSVWLQINEGQTYTAGMGISIASGVITNTAIVAEPLSQVVIGTGASVTSDTTLKKIGNTLKIAIPNTTLTEPAIWIDFQSNLATTNTAILNFVDMRAFSKRISNTSPHGKFPSWSEMVSWGQPGSGTDTVGNLIKTRGFNLFGTPGYNAKFPTVQESIEQRYSFPSDDKWGWEWHIEYFDTLGRDARPYTLNYAYDGSNGGIAFTSSKRHFFKMPVDIGSGSDTWEIANFRTGVEEKYYPADVRIRDRTNHTLLQKLSSNTAGYRNVLNWRGNNQLELGDSSGVRVTNRIEFVTLSSTPEIYAPSGNLLLDSLKLTINTNDINSRYEVVKNVSSVNTMEHCFDGTNYYLERNSGSTRPIQYGVNAPSWSFIVANNGDVGVGTGAFGPDLGAKFRVAEASSTRTLMRIVNPSGFNDVYRTSATPTGLITGTDGDIDLSPSGFYVKYAGVWARAILAGDYGTGSNGQVTTWGTSNLLSGQNQLFYAGGNLSIGTNTANSRLYVVGGDGSIMKSGGASLFLGDLNFESPGAYNLAPGLTALFNASTSVTSDLGFYTYSGGRNLRAVIDYNGRMVIGASAPAASAKLDVTSTTQGFLPPRMTTTQRDAISSPATGLTVYCTDCTAFDLSTGVMVTWNGVTWKTNW